MKVTPYRLLYLALAFIYIVFGALKVLGRSPIEPLVLAMIPLLSTPPFFALFGLGEVFLGIGLLFKQIRRFAALGIIVHMLSTFMTLIMVPSRIFSSETVVTLEGEFVFKNILLISVAYYLWRKENGGSKEVDKQKSNTT